MDFNGPLTDDDEETEETHEGATTTTLELKHRYRCRSSRANSRSPFCEVAVVTGILHYKTNRIATKGKNLIEISTDLISTLRHTHGKKKETVAQQERTESIRQK